MMTVLIPLPPVMTNLTYLLSRNPRSRIDFSFVNILIFVLFLPRILQQQENVLCIMACGNRGFFLVNGIIVILKCICIYISSTSSYAKMFFLIAILSLG